MRYEAGGCVIVVSIKGTFLNVFGSKCNLHQNGHHPFKMVQIRPKCLS